MAAAAAAAAAASPLAGLRARATAPGLGAARRDPVTTAAASRLEETSGRRPNEAAAVSRTRRGSRPSSPAGAAGLRARAASPSSPSAPALAPARGGAARFAGAAVSRHSQRSLSPTGRQAAGCARLPAAGSAQDLGCTGDLDNRVDRAACASPSAKSPPRTPCASPAPSRPASRPTSPSLATQRSGTGIASWASGGAVRPLQRTGSEKSVSAFKPPQRTRGGYTPTKLALNGLPADAADWGGVSGTATPSRSSVPITPTTATPDGSHAAEYLGLGGSAFDGLLLDIGAAAAAPDAKSARCSPAPSPGPSPGRSVPGRSAPGRVAPRQLGAGAAASSPASRTRLQGSMSISQLPTVPRSGAMPPATASPAVVSQASSRASSVARGGGPGVRRGASAALAGGPQRSPQVGQRQPVGPAASGAGPRRATGGSGLGVAAGRAGGSPAKAPQGTAAEGQIPPLSRSPSKPTSGPLVDPEGRRTVGVEHMQKNFDQAVVEQWQKLQGSPALAPLPSAMPGVLEESASSFCRDDDGGGSTHSQSAGSSSSSVSTPRSVTLLSNGRSFCTSRGELSDGAPFKAGREDGICDVSMTNEIYKVRLDQAAATPKPAEAPPEPGCSAAPVGLGSEQPARPPAPALACAPAPSLASGAVEVDLLSPQRLCNNQAQCRLAHGDFDAAVRGGARRPSAPAPASTAMLGGAALTDGHSPAAASASASAPGSRDATGATLPEGVASLGGAAASAGPA
mmetsp:Transcript_25504/g.85358  ORF Transcript_25504/g.85358 Transcript_25504/m.85358 type:complete len:740 (+) Transcript_25504:103-2322(+)